MQFTLPAGAEAFRKEVRDFQAERPMQTYSVDATDGGYGTGPFSAEFLRALGRRGWIGLTWPEELGGGGRPMIDQLAMLEEFALAGAPFGPLVGNDQWAQSLIRDSNERLRDELLPVIAAGEATCWQGFSEPDAGSDLLALTTKATRDGDEYSITGRKIWSSEAGAYTHGQVLARTESIDDAGGRSNGLTMFVVPNDAPGLTLRPILAMTGEVYHYEAFLDEVRVPEWRVLGRAGEGFRELLRGLDRDRFWGRFTKPANLLRKLDQIEAYARSHSRDGRPIIDDSGVARGLVELRAESAATRLLFHKLGWQLSNELPVPYESALYKTMADELGQRVANFAAQVLEQETLIRREPHDFETEMRQLYLSSPGQTIAGGTSEVLRTTVATRGLGLPKG
ncbi:MAG: acyl-CoA dehydrogenase family protein [Actinomycetota bacterium]|nr:acyl-CoA dehydrogenase family protein [Actinomycetota bacterium]